MRPPRLLLALLLVGAAVAGCGSTPSSTVASRVAPLRTGSIAAAGPTKVLVVMEENHTAASALRGMPFLAALAGSYGRATSYRAASHPSLPNYLAIAGGSTFGVHDDRAPASHHLSGPSAFDRVLASGGTAKTYAEAMPSPCSLAATTRYAVKHNPWTYFSDAGPRSSCRKYDVPAGTTSSGALRSDIDAGRLPNVGMLIPDICHDGHDCSLATADSWLKSWLNVVRAGPDYTSGRLAIVVTFDEDDSRGNNTVLAVVVSPYTSHVVSTRALTHYSLTRYFGELTSTTPLRSAASAASLRADFHI